MQLQKAESDIVQLLTHIGMFIKWWSDMKTRLFNVKQKISRFGSRKPDTTIVLSLKERWFKVENDYRGYMCEVNCIFTSSIDAELMLYFFQISKLQDFYPKTHTDYQVEDSLEKISVRVVSFHSRA